MRKNFDLPSIKKRLAGTSGEKYWRSLDELAETEEFKDFLHHEFPQNADQWLNPLGRRNFLKLMAASMALGGLAACAPPRTAQKIVPYVRQPEEMVPGTPLFFASAFVLDGVASGVVVESHTGRPTKVGGNPDHPGSLGRTNAFTQASILSLYDPDRSQSVTSGGRLSAWDSFLNEFILETSAQGLTGGAGLRIMTGTVTSPSMMAQLNAILEKFPDAKVIQYDPVNQDYAVEGARLAFDEPVNPVYSFDRAKRIVSLESDFMAPGPGDVRYAHDFAEARRVTGENQDMNRLYLVESTPSTTGTMADHRLPLKSSQIPALALALAAELGLDVDAPDLPASVPDNWISAVAEDLKAHSGESLVIAGRSQPPIVHALAHAINEELGNVDNTVVYTAPLSPFTTNQTQSLVELVDDMNTGVVRVLVLLETNPVYNAPRDLDFAAAMENVDFRVNLSLYENETSAACQWHVPAKHYLESWGDARAFDGTVTLIQPLILPLYPAAHSAAEILAVMLDNPDLTDYDIVRQYWETESGASDFEQFWRESLFNGFVADSALPARSVSVDMAAISAESVPEIADQGTLEVVFRPDPTVWDGRFANNGWLQELPKPLSKLTWDNALLVSPNTASALGLSTNDLVRLHHGGRNVFVPVWIMPGQADDSVSVTLGYGRKRAGRVGSDVGANAYDIRTAATPWYSTDGVTITSFGDTYKLASTQLHWSMESRHPVKGGTLEQYKEDPHFVAHIGEHELDPNDSLMDGWEYNSYKWGMVVDLTTCNGCNACVTACQAENNIPVVGKEQVLNGREMHWMRIDTYYEGNPENPHTYLQPVMCQHCEQAPCELVCPVAATVHDHEGLNVMVYNRCIGTRYCANNCPYKVRRFNYLQFSDQTTESLKGMRNPNVTVRVRGVMEKCSYCVQRISAARIKAKNENRPIADGEVISACQAACPSKAIVFGDLNTEGSEVARLAQSPLNYGLLSELGTRPRTTYLAKLTNPNPGLEDTHTGENGDHS